jgi:hypothetical protein
MSHSNAQDYGYQNSTLSLMYDLEFKQAHKIALKKSNKDLPSLMLLNLSTQFTYQSPKFISTYNNIMDLNFYKKIIHNSNNNNSIYSYKYNTLNLFTSSLNLESLMFQNKPNLRFAPNNLDLKTHFTPMIYENTVLDDVEETADNLRFKNIKFPIRLIKGIINKHNYNVLHSNSHLNKNILFNAIINKNDITEKIPQSESF